MQPISFAQSHALQFAVALGIGLLIGVERERRKGRGAARAAAGVRTFALTALLGALGFEVGGTLLLAVTTVALAGLAALGYQRTRNRDPGITSETALLLTLLLGAQAMREPIIASGLGVMVAVLLAARSRLHYFVSSVLTEAELYDALLLGAAALIVLPMLPNRALGPFDAINPRTLWIIVVLMLSISAAGHIALRVLGPRYGLPLAGLVSGFVSSVATINSMGARARQNPELMPAAVAGAALSTLATFLQMAAMLSAISTDTLLAMALPLVCAGLTIFVYALWLVRRSLRQSTQVSFDTDHAFSIGAALMLAATMALVLFVSAALNAWLGGAGLMIGISIAGFADTHAPAVSVASLVAGGKLGVNDAVLLILMAMSANTVTKIVIAIISGGRSFALQIVPGLMLAIIAAWLAVWMGTWLHDWLGGWTSAWLRALALHVLD